MPSDTRSSDESRKAPNGVALFVRRARRAVEHVEQPRDEEQDARIDEVVEDDQGRNTRIEHGAGDGDSVGGDPELVESGEERREAFAQT